MKNVFNVGKKGFFFTLLVIVLFFLLMLSIRSWVKFQEGREQLNAIEARASALSSMVESADADAERMTGVAGERAVRYAAFYAAYNLTALKNSSEGIGELMWNCSLNGSQCYGVPVGTCSSSSGTCCFNEQMENACFALWGERFAEKVSRYNANASFEEMVFSASQVSPFEVSVSVEMLTSLDDLSGVASFSRHSNFSKRVSIIGFEDPIYAIYKRGEVHRTITPWPYPEDYVLVSVNATGASGGNGWVYGSVVNLGACCVVANCTDGTLDLADRNKTLVVNNIAPIAANCPEKANAFRGIIFNTDGGNPDSITANITVPYAYNFTGYNVTERLRNGTGILLNNDGTRHELLDVENLRTLLYSGKYYRESWDGPDFMKRLENNFSASIYGIESLVNYSIATRWSNSSWVDYYFFSGRNCTVTGCFKVKGTLNCENASTCANTSLVHFLLDNNSVFLNGTPTHLEYYQVENITLPN